MAAYRIRWHGVADLIERDEGDGWRPLFAFKRPRRRPVVDCEARQAVEPKYLATRAGRPLTTTWTPHG